MRRHLIHLVALVVGVLSLASAWGRGTEDQGWDRQEDGAALFGNEKVAHAVSKIDPTSDFLNPEATAAKWDHAALALKAPGMSRGGLNGLAALTLAAMQTDAVISVQIPDNLMMDPPVYYTLCSVEVDGVNCSVNTVPTAEEGGTGRWACSTNLISKERADCSA